MSLRRLSLSAVTASVVVLAGCMVGPDYERADVGAPETYQFVVDPGESLANVEWFEIFADPALEELVKIALEENKDLLTAIARIEEARAQLGFVKADLYPQVGGTARGQKTNGTIIPGFRTEAYVLAGSLSWEIDLWGKLRRANESARAQLLSTIEARNQVQVTLISDVASTYLLLLDLDDRVQIALDTLNTRKESTRIIQARYDEGIVPLLDVNQAQIEEADAAAELAELQRLQQQTENQLSILLGRNPQAIVRGKGLMDIEPIDAIPTGLPSELLERRPDVRQAEQALAAQTAQIGVAQAQRFPSLSLTGSLGLVSSDLSDFIDSDNTAGAFGFDLVGPIFDAGKRRSNVEVQRARTEQLQRQYEQTIIEAFADVEDTLIAIEKLGDELEARRTQMIAAQSASKLSRARYDGGVTSYLEVLESERSKFRAELSQSIVRRERLVAYVELYKALGGGWTPEPK